MYPSNIIRSVGLFSPRLKHIFHKSFSTIYGLLVSNGLPSQTPLRFTDYLCHSSSFWLSATKLTWGCRVTVVSRVFWDFVNNANSNPPFASYYHNFTSPSFPHFPSFSLSPLSSYSFYPFILTYHSLSLYRTSGANPPVNGGPGLTPNIFRILICDFGNDLRLSFFMSSPRKRRTADMTLSPSAYKVYFMNQRIVSY